MGEFRWRLVDERQDGLFERQRRVVGRGEYRSLTFWEVEARSIINEVPAAARLPFRYTINPYRGCSHGCVYCLSGDTPILMGDGSQKPISEIRVGDTVYGTARAGPQRRYVLTEVLDHWQTVKPGYRVTLADGTELVASGDHRFLTDRGWKFVAPRRQSDEWRPHLTPSDRLLGLGSTSRSEPECDQYRAGYLCGLIRGDGRLGSYPHQRRGRSPADAHRFRAASVDPGPVDRAQRYLPALGLETTPFEIREESVERGWESPKGPSRGGAGATMGAPISWPERPSDEWSRGFLAGIFDAEASYSRGISRIANTHREVLPRVRDWLRRLGFTASIGSMGRPDGPECLEVTRGLGEVGRLLSVIDPVIQRGLEGTSVEYRGSTDVEAIEPLGVTLPMFDVTTGTGDFIANGVVSHNCFARPTHDYLGFGIGEDFDTQIVVKVNAVELLWAETQPGRWAGAPIAMGTNTDPYQKAEGKYRLTRGIVETLIERGNPFSILTKSTLALRDLELFVQAAGSLDVSVNFSIPTLDEEVWRTTEPGTPKPGLRMEAVRRLNESGVPSGVMVAPLLPGISDSDDQVEGVKTAAREAGATFVTPMKLHLKPGVKEHYIGWLADSRPELVPRYEDLYRGRAYLPGESRRSSRKPARRSPPAPQKPEQLRLL